MTVSRIHSNTAIVHKRKAGGFGQLTKNALQNVMQYFRPWGRDFIVLRSVNKRVKAAYHDHLRGAVNIDKFMARN